MNYYFILNSQIKLNYNFKLKKINSHFAIIININTTSKNSKRNSEKKRYN